MRTLQTGLLAIADMASANWMRRHGMVADVSSELHIILMERG
jgi:hypothetical protein